MIAYAESSTVNLRAIERLEVEFEGILERNTDPKEAPVFVVQKVLSGGAEQMRPWTIPALNLTVSLPKSWKGSIKGGSASFTASGFTAPVLSITTKKIAASSLQPLYGPLAVSAAAEEVLVVGLRKATVDSDEASEAWVVRVHPSSGGTAETIFTFALRPAVPVASQVILYRNILKTVTFTASPSVSSRSASSALPARSSASSVAGSRAEGEGAACGGVAGILCPRGLYCKITDPVSESGVCTVR